MRLGTSTFSLYRFPVDFAFGKRGEEQGKVFSLSPGLVGKMAGDVRNSCRKILSCPFGPREKDGGEKEKKERKENTAKGGGGGDEKKDHGEIEEKHKGGVSSGDFHLASRKAGEPAREPQDDMGK